MEDLSVPKYLEIKSNIHDYRVHFCDSFVKELEEDLESLSAVIIDEKVYSLYENDLKKLLDNKLVYKVKALESNKNLNYAQRIMEFIIEHGFKRNHTLITIGGGICQDLACFIGTILFRGISWKFYPTTLLSQCDSCIGSKSSLNFGQYKNQVGTFYPPQKIVIDSNFTRTLKHEDILSGLGEAIKVHYLDEEQRYQLIFDNYEASLNEQKRLDEVIFNSLLIKKRVIEIDEYDVDYRNIMNYGHTFGHALETAADYNISHGIAVTYGLGLANYLSLKLGYLDQETWEKMEELISENTGNIQFQISDMELIWNAMRKDKKNVDRNINFILTKGFGKMFKVKLPLDDRIQNIVIEYLNKQKLLHA
jgi:3-dehydroquinate synthase